MGQCDKCNFCHHGRHDLPETEPPEIVATTSWVWGDTHVSDWIIVERLQECPFLLETASTYVNCCKKFVMIAVKCDGRVLKFASNELRDDEEVVLAAIQQNPMAIAFATEHLLQTNDRVCMQAIFMYPIIVCKQFEWNDILSYRHVIYALEQNPHVYEDLDDMWKNRLDIAQLAVSGCWILINHVPDPLWCDPKLLIKVVGHEKWSYDDGYYNEIEWYYFRHYTEVMKIGALNDPALMCVAGKLQYDRSFACKIVSKFGSEIDKDYFRFRHDTNVVLCALRGDGMVLAYFTNHDEINLDMAMTAVCNNGMALQYVPHHMRDNEDNGIVRAALLNNGLALQFVSAEMQRNRDVVKTAVCRNGRALQFAHVDVRDNDEVVHLATRNNPCSMTYASTRLHGDIGLVMLTFQLMIYNGVLLKEYRDEDFPHWINVPLLSQNVASLRPEMSDSTFVNLLCGCIICSRDDGGSSHKLDIPFTFLRENVEKCLIIFQTVAVRRYFHVS
jgi:hypothetical protein